MYHDGKVTIRLPRGKMESQIQTTSLLCPQKHKCNTGNKDIQDTVEEREGMEILPRAIESITKVAAFDLNLA